MNQERFDRLTDEEIDALLQKHVDWSLWCDCSSEQVKYIEIEDTYEVDASTGMPLEN